jgi:hypothetical protein
MHETEREALEKGIKETNIANIYWKTKEDRKREKTENGLEESNKWENGRRNKNKT